MRTFDVLLNGKKLCVAGVGDAGSLSAIISWKQHARKVGKTKNVRRGKEDLRLYVNGASDSTAEYVTWIEQTLQAGDEICIRIAEADLAGAPIRRERSDWSEVMRAAEEKYLEKMAKRLGWKLLKVTPPKAE